MSYSQQRQALSVSGVNSDSYNQRSYNYTNSSYYSSDLGVSTISSATGTVRPIKNTKNYLNDVESKFNSDPDPRADLQLLSRHKNKTNQYQLGAFKIEKDIKEDQVPQIFRKMQPIKEEQNYQKRNAYQNSPIRNSIQMSQINGQQQQQQPFKILNYNHNQQQDEVIEHKKGFFENLFSFSSNNNENTQQKLQIKNYKSQNNLQNINDIESSLMNLRNDLQNNQNNNNKQFDFTFQMRQQLGIAIDLINRVLREQKTSILQQLIKSISRARHHAKHQLYTSEQQLMDAFFEQVEFLTQQKILKLKVDHIPTEEQVQENRQQFYQMGSQYIFNSKGYYPTKQQLDLFYDEMKHLNVQSSEWIDFIARRI